MDTGLVVTFVGIIVAGLAGILGVWLERDSDAPSGWAWVFTSLIVLATAMKLAHSIVQKAEGEETAEALSRVLDRLVVLSEASDDPALDQFVGAELAVQARSNPEVMDRVRERVKERGGDPGIVRRKAVAGRRASAGLPPRAKATKATKAAKAAAAEAAKLGKAVEDELGPLVPGPDGELPEIPTELPVELPELPAGLPELPVTFPPVPEVPPGEAGEPEEGKTGKTGKAGKAGKNR